MQRIALRGDRFRGAYAGTRFVAKPGCMLMASCMNRTLAGIAGRDRWQERIAGKVGHAATLGIQTLKLLFNSPGDAFFLFFVDIYYPC
jgi:hypothetical protein